jgi:DinB family protein
MARPEPTEYIPYYEKYISLVPEEDILRTLAEQLTEVRAFVQAIPEERGGYRYAPGKWSVREVLDHLTDVERIYGYRAFCFARGEKKPLPGVEVDDYAAESGADGLSLRQVLEEFESVRRSTLAMLRRFSEEAWLRTGTASDDPVSVRALAYILAGHVRHHLGILRERYGVGTQEA